jgi:hypothetical protein
LHGANDQKVLAGGDRESVGAGFTDSGFNEYEILEGYGTVSRKHAEQKAHAEYDQFNKQQRIESDFDREIKQRLSRQDKDA